MTHREKQHHRQTLAWRDFQTARGITKLILREELFDDRRVKRSTERIAFHTALVVIYARPFTTAKGFVGLSDNVLKVLSPEQRDLHRAILDLRHQLYAHTDAEHHEVKMEVSEGKAQTTFSIPRVNIFGFPKEVIEDLAQVIGLLEAEVNKRMKEFEKHVAPKST